MTKTPEDLLESLKGLLRLAERRGNSRNALAAAIGASEAQLGRLASGDLDGWTTLMVERLATVVGLDPAAVWAPGWRPRELHASFRRGPWGDLDQADVATFERALERGAVLRAMRALVSPDELDLRARFRARAPGSPPFQDGYDLAKSVREALENAREPLPELRRMVPERLGIAVQLSPLRTRRVLAAALFDGESEAIVVNQTPDLHRAGLRRLIAHELAHVLFDTRALELGLFLDAEEPHAGSSSLDGSSPEEARANAFAAELLVPSAGVQVSLGVPLRVDDVTRARQMVRSIAERFDAPYELTTRHLRNLNYISEAAVTAILEGPLPATPEPMRAVSDVVDEWIERALERDLITKRRAAELREAG